MVCQTSENFGGLEKGGRKKHGPAGGERRRGRNGQEVLVKEMTWIARLHG